MRPALAALLGACALLLASCGEERAGEGTASLWITRDRGAVVLAEATVPAGITAMDALRREADVATRHGGRFVQAVDGLEGSADEQRDWFWFVNGLEGDRSAAEYRLRPGDVAWWDYRSWAEAMREPVVVGAFPEPFLHGFGGKTRPAAVRYELPADAEAARAIGKLVGARSVGRAGVPVAREANLFLVARGRREFSATLEGGPTGRVRFVIGGDGAGRLAADSSLARFRYRGLRP